jgi:hypothetical protein
MNPDIEAVIETLRNAIRRAIAAAIAEEREKWLIATAHEHTELQAEGAATIRARGKGGESHG